jgi:hypothetical protein
MLKVIDGHIHAGFGESFGDGPADPSARAGHESNFSSKVVHGFRAAPPQHVRKSDAMGQPAASDIMSLSFNPQQLLMDS